MKRARDSRGFSLVEVLIAFSIILVIAAIATPNIVRSLRAYRVGAVSTDVANIIQRTRFEAIRRNIITTARAQVAGNQVQVWIDYNRNQQVDANEPFILLPADMAFLDQGQVPSPKSMGYANTRLIQGQISFDGKGTVDFNGAAPAVLLCYVGNPNDPSSGYRAVAVLPAGKTRIWRASGANGYWY